MFVHAQIYLVSFIIRFPLHMHPSASGQYDAIVMPWLMALVQYRLVPTLTRRVQLVLVGALRQVAGQRSEAGVWASRLEAAIAAHGV
jgi:hypothetical protein